MQSRVRPDGWTQFMAVGMCRERWKVVLCLEESVLRSMPHVADTTEPEYAGLFENVLPIKFFDKYHVQRNQPKCK